MTNKDEDVNFQQLLINRSAIVSTCVALKEFDDENPGTRIGSTNITQKWVQAETIFSRLGEHLFTKCHQMSQPLVGSFTIC